MASCSSNTARARPSRSTTGASAPPPSTRRAASACAPWPARRRATPIPASCRRRRSAAPRRRWARCGRAAPARSTSAPRADQCPALRGREPARADGRSRPRRACSRRSTPMPAAATRACVQVMASLFGEWQAVQILRPDGARVADLRPLVRLNVSVVVEQNGRRETGGHGMGGRFAYARIARARELAGGGGRGAAPGAGQPRQRARAGRRDGGGARPGLARHPAARGDRPRAGGRLQPQEDLGLRRACSASASPRRA